MPGWSVTNRRSPSRSTSSARPSAVSASRPRTRTEVIRTGGAPLRSPPVTYVAVHGGGPTGGTWACRVPFLDAPCAAADLPGRGAVPADLGSITVDDEVAAVVAAAPDGPFVLVAHSSGGLLVPGVVAARGADVQAVVLIAALVPPEGGCGLDGMKES